METLKPDFVHILAVLKNSSGVMIPMKYELLLDSWPGVVTIPIKFELLLYSWPGAVTIPVKFQLLLDSWPGVVTTPMKFELLLDSWPRVVTLKKSRVKSLKPTIHHLVNKYSLLMLVNMTVLCSFSTSVNIFHNLKTWSPKVIMLVLSFKFLI